MIVLQSVVQMLELPWDLGNISCHTDVIISRWWGPISLVRGTLSNYHARESADLLQQMLDRPHHQFRTRNLDAMVPSHE
jgi:hypothetical protein